MNWRPNWTALFKATMMLLGAGIFIAGFVFKEWKEEKKEALDALENVARVAQLRLRVDEVGRRVSAQSSTNSTGGETADIARIKYKAAAIVATGDDIDEYIQNLTELSSALSDPKVVQSKPAKWKEDVSRARTKAEDIQEILVNAATAALQTAEHIASTASDKQIYKHA
jgi:hypothetical protein